MVGVCNSAAASAAPADRTDLVESYGPLVGVQNNAPAADGWVQFAPFGEFPAVIEEQGKEKTVVQLYNAETGAALVADFTRRKAAGQEFFIDDDHAAEAAAANTSASAWVQGMEVRADGIYIKPEYTEKGTRLVTGKTYRFGSPVVGVRNSGRKDTQGREIYLPVMVGTPGTITWRAVPMYALTNAPNIRTIKPMMNRAPTSAGNGPAGNKDNDTMNKELLKLLGLPEESDIAAALNAVQALKDKAGKIDELTAALNAAKEEKVQGALMEYADVIPAETKAAVEGMLRLNADVTVSGLKALRNAAKATKPAGAVTPLHNRATAGTPDPKKLTAPSAKDERLLNRAREIAKAEGLEFSAAFNAAVNRHPELVTAAE